MASLSVAFSDLIQSKSMHVTTCGCAGCVGTTGPLQPATSTGTGDATGAGLPTYTGDQVAQFLTHGYWGGSYHSFNITADNIITVNLAALTTAGQTLARAALTAWSEVANIRFQEVTTSADMSFDDNQAGAFASGTWSGNNITSMHVNVSTDWLATSGTEIDSYSFQTYVHEIGHALGLGHGGAYNGSATWGTSNHYTNDNWGMSVMSYFDQATAGQGSPRFVMGPQIADIIAVHNLYGANTGTRTGNTTYGYNANAGSLFSFASYGEAPAFSVYDAGGIDTLDGSGHSGAQTINLASESYSSMGGLTNNISIAKGTVVENAIGGTGNDVLLGNGADNQLTGNGGSDLLTGNGGNDTLDGGAGADTMTGGTGNDTYRIDNTGDVVTEGASDGTADRVEVSFTNYTVAANIEVVAVNTTTGLRITAGATGVTMLGNAGADTLTGSAVADTIDGGGGADVLAGLAGNDTISGGAANDTITGGLGNDSLTGGTGNDRFVITKGDGLDVVVDYASGDVLDLRNYGVSTFAGLQPFLSQSGADTIITFDAANRITLKNVTMGSLTATGFLFSNDVPGVTLTGTAAADTLTGSNNNDIISGLAGNDTLSGLAGNDTIDGGDGNDVVTGGAGIDQLSGGAGYDIVWADAADTSLNGGTGYDYLVFTDAVDRTVILGSMGFETVIGNSGSDTLDFTGATSDLLLIAWGGAGNDIITLGASTGYAYGQDGNDWIQGSTANAIDVMIGGAGADTMLGGGGNDLFWVDAQDVVDGGTGIDWMIMESAAGGTMTVGNNNVEVLAGNAGNDTIDARANTTGLVIWGNGGADNLYAGKGADHLYGGGSDGAQDVFRFTSGWGLDQIWDFENGRDRISVKEAGITSMSQLSITSSGNVAVISQLGTANKIYVHKAAGLIDAGDFIF